MMTMQQETIVKGQEECHLSFDLVRDVHGQTPFLVVTVHGPEQALCMKFQRRSVKDLIRTLTQFHDQLKHA